MNFECHLSTALDKEHDELVAYAMDGYILPVIDLSGGIATDTIWDELVPKSDSDLAFELDDSADADPTWSPGEQVSEVITGMFVQKPTRFFKRRKWFSNASMGFATYDFASNSWFPAEFFKTAVRKSFNIARPSAIMIGFSNPNMGQDISNVELLPTGATIEWALLKHIGDTQKDVIRMLLGLWSEGSGSFGLDEAEEFMENIVSDFGVVDDTTTFKINSWKISCIANARIMVPGTLKTGAIKAD